MNRTEEGILKLKERIEKNPLEYDEELLQYIQLASRMKALGDSTAFDKLPEIFKKDQFNGKLDQILLERCQRGMWDIDEQEGEDLALSIIEAQDFKLFYIFSCNTGWYSKNIHKMFEQWAEETSLKIINEETESLLKDWLDTYPVPEEYCLPVVAVPVTEFAYDIAGKIASFLPRKRIQGTWSKQVTEIERRPHAPAYNPAVFAACDDGTPPDSLREQQANLVYMIDNGKIQILRRLNDRWQMGIEIRDSKGNPVIPVQVRVGAFAARRDDKHPERWILDMKPLSGVLRNYLVNAPTSVLFTPAGELVIKFSEV
ncbi:MAG: hypothetical protein IJK97_12345 [Thermoguttaceae bacterium]|nr:hypothetical protein [Thermoguttaceae bacterium]MBR0191111.1 hypothetical protein [Thermoguttaceae bacterium]